MLVVPGWDGWDGWDGWKTGEDADAPPPPHAATIALKTTMLTRLALQLIRLRGAKRVSALLRNIIMSSTFQNLTSSGEL
jgi:hypothetical protein